MEKKITPRITIGVTIVAVLILADILLRKAYHPLPDGVRYLTRLVLTFAGVLGACLLHSKQSGGRLGFGEVFSYGFRTTALVAFLMAVYTFAMIQFIEPAPSPAEMDAAVKAIEQQGNALHEEARQQASAAAANRWIIYVSLSIFVSLIPGVLGSLAGAAVTKKNQ